MKPGTMKSDLSEKYTKIIKLLTCVQFQAYVLIFIILGLFHKKYLDTIIGLWDHYEIVNHNRML
jgi:hypothetical protein